MNLVGNKFLMEFFGECHDKSVILYFKNIHQSLIYLCFNHYFNKKASFFHCYLIIVSAFLFAKAHEGHTNYFHFSFKFNFRYFWRFFNLLRIITQEHS